MKIKNISWGLLTFLGFTTYSQNTNKKANDKTTYKTAFSLYKKTENTIHTIRALSADDNTFSLYSYELNISSPEDSKQIFISVEELTTQQLDNKKPELHTKYDWTPFKGDEILFVQIQPIGFQDEMELLNKRHEIESKLDILLRNKNIGEWVAGDLGPGGGNMLFTVTDINKALQTTLDILSQNNLDKNVLVGKRVLLDKDDWFYEVIYPTKYSGAFNTM